jgi:ADP-ribose pyrophosphatase YjhB (NUDIX family)
VGDDRVVPDPVVRPTARVLLVDHGRRTLLFEGRDERRGATSFWFPPGGGVEPGETHELAALRVLREETGLVADTPGPHVFVRTHLIELEGVATLVEESWFFARCEPFEIDTSGFTELERATVRAHRWWPLEELPSTRDRLVPRDHAARVRALLEDGPPPAPLRLGI